MNENEKPALGSTEAAVLTVVELIARAASMSEQHLSYWLDLYYQVRSRYELDDMVVKAAEPDPVMARLDELKDKVRNLEETIRRADSKPVDFKIYPVDKDNKQKWLEQAAAEAVDRTVNAIDISAMLGKEQEQHSGDTPGASAPTEKAEEDPTPVMRGRETIKLQERAKSESRSEAVKRQKAEERAFKMRVADRLREARANGVKIGDIVTASCGDVPDGAVMTILEGRFRPIADYRALDAALDQLAKDNTSTVTAEP